MRVLYSFPHKLGAERICTTAWYQVAGLAQAGAQVTVFPGAVTRQVPSGVEVRPTLARGRFRIPYRALGRMNAFMLHDLIVARRLRKLAGQVDIVHTWPLGALQTLKTAAELGIPTVLERPNAHTRFAYEVVRQECVRLGVVLPPDHEHAYNEEVLAREEAEYQTTMRLLCPSDFVARTFRERGFTPVRLARHQYGFDETQYFPPVKREPAQGLTMLFAGGCAPRKGLHYALDAWLRSGACEDGTFVIAGAFVPGYEAALSSMLAHPSVRVLGHRKDVPALMRASDVFVLPSIEEGSALVTSEARGSGCVLLVSDASGAVCAHMRDALVHQAGDVEALTQHIRLLNEDRSLLEGLRRKSLDGAQQITWSAAGARLLEVYRESIDVHRETASVPGASVA
jgi:glycosyltransferase involved in cell wall biosynthesis